MLRAHRVCPPCMLILGTLFIGIGSHAMSQDEAETSPQIARIEEDWELKLLSPDSDIVAPQISHVLTPNGTTNGVHGVFELNHQTLPDYQGGGMQLQYWWGEEDLSFHTAGDSSRLGTDGETITYTLSMEAQDAGIEFSVSNGQSKTWGTFGGKPLTFNAASRGATLEKYSAAASAQQAKIGFGKNRVSALVLKEVRYYTADGSLAKKDVDDVVVHSN